MPEKIRSDPEHRWVTVKAIRRYCNGRWWPVTAEMALFSPGQVRISRCRYRGSAITAP